MVNFLASPHSLPSYGEFSRKIHNNDQSIKINCNFLIFLSYLKLFIFSLFFVGVFVIIVSSDFLFFLYIYIYFFVFVWFFFINVFCCCCCLLWFFTNVFLLGFWLSFSVVRCWMVVFN